MDGPYTTITVQSFNHLEATIKKLRGVVQQARELLEEKKADDALDLLKSEA